MTGGSQGLGLATARLLVGRGANVTIMARTQSKLDAAVSELKVRLHPHRYGWVVLRLDVEQTYRKDDRQQIQAVSVDLTDPKATSEAFDRAEAGLGSVDWMITSVGGAAGYLDLFEDLSPDQLRGCMDTNYFAVLWSVRVSPISFFFG